MKNFNKQKKELQDKQIAKIGWLWTSEIRLNAPCENDKLFSVYVS